MATMNDVPEGAYPFTTIDPAVGEAYVRVHVVEIVSTN
jgi:ribosome-binding ATPase YchF (GTP1/OBG family)